MSWPELWSFYRRTSETVQSTILQQIDLPDLIKYASEKVKKEVLSEAPLEIRQEFEPHPVSFNPYMGLSHDELMQALFGSKAPQVQKEMDTPRAEKIAKRQRRGFFHLFRRC